ncbi:MAG: hypothetical protein Q7R62_01460 [bacterium]|nr:hypothetical protein [bacterium]
MRNLTILAVIVLAVLAAAISTSWKQDDRESEPTNATVAPEKVALEKQIHDLESEITRSQDRVTAEVIRLHADLLDQSAEQAYVLAKASGKSHPEQGDDEVFLTNTTIENFGRIGWKSKRLGTVAFSPGGKVSGRVSPGVRDKLVAEAAKMPARVYDSGIWNGNYFSRSRLKSLLQFSSEEMERASYISLPVFAKRDELVRAGVDPDRKR